MRAVTTNATTAALRTLICVHGGMVHGGVIDWISIQVRWLTVWKEQLIHRELTGRTTGTSAAALCNISAAEMGIETNLNRTERHIESEPNKSLLFGFLKVQQIGRLSEMQQIYLKFYIHHIILALIY